MANHAVGLTPEAAALFVLSFRHRDELLVAASRGGWRAIAARRATGVERRFIASGAGLVIVDGRGAFEEALGAIRALADPVEANAAGMLVLLSRSDVVRLGDVYAAGATHYLASPFAEAELLQCLRFAARHAERLGGSATTRPALKQIETLSWSWTPAGLQFSPALRALYGLGAEPVTVKRACRLIGHEGSAAARAARLRLRAGYGSTAFSHFLPSGVRVAHHLIAGNGGMSGLIEPLDASEFRSLPRHRDPLTGLPDGTAARRWLIDQVDSGRAPGVLLVGLSRVDRANSLYGRVGGDAVLQAAARRIEAAARETSGSSWIARLAGTEFMVALPHASPDQLAQLAQSILSAIERRLLTTPDLFLLGADIGGAIAAGEDAGTLLRRASAALAEAREATGNAIRLLDAGAAEAAARAQQLAEDLSRGMESGEIEILFQPQVSIGEDRIDGVEALARWRHPALGELGAEALFGAAARANLVTALSELVQRRALEIAMSWADRLPSLRLSINVTAADLGRPDFARLMLDMIDASGFPRHRVTAEITEEGLIEDLGMAAATLAELRRGGARIAVDDFGTGYSSLAYLKALPLDYLKLDRRLSQDIVGSARDRVVVRSVIDMARSLGLGVIAEGVETKEQLALLAAEGCTLYQGFLCSGPITAEELVRLVSAAPASKDKCGDEPVAGRVRLG